MNNVGILMNLFSKSFEEDPKILAQTISVLKSKKPIKEIEFDKILPIYYQLQSRVQWSPIAVAQQIADWTAGFEKRKIIDIGCGVGKLCLLLRILTHHKIYGIEQRENLVVIANQIIKANGFKGISISNMNMLDMDWDDFDIYYLYNPFQEHVENDDSFIIEKNIELDMRIYPQYTSAVYRQLIWAKPGKVLITFHGYGGRIPEGWTMVSRKLIKNGDLQMWVKD